jgi:anaerobic magnesium-protoporphyrin IX monomethyl ester cyclase
MSAEANKCRILLLNPRISGDVRYGKFKSVGSYLPPYGLLSIAGVLEQKGHAVKIIDADTQKGLTLDDIRQVINDFRPDIVGLTAYSIARRQVIDTAAFIKSISPALIVVGGPHVIVFPEDLSDCDSIDILAYGEGEFTMSDIAEYYLSRKDISQIDGILYKRDGQVIKTKSREFISDLDSLPYPAYHLLDDLEGYKPMQLLYKRLPMVTFITGRGCPFNCIFCNSIWGKKIRLNSPEYIAGFIRKMVREHHIKEILFYEDTFLINKDRVDRLCDIIISENIKIIWSCSANIRTVDKPILQKMKRAGCWLVSFGVESGNNEVLKFIRKPSTVEEARQACRWADEAGLKIRGFFIIGHLIDTRETIRDTINLAKTLPLFTVNICILQLLPGSKVREIAHNYGEVNYDLSLGTGHPGDTMSFVPKGLTVEYLHRMQRQAYFEFFVRPVQIWRLVRSIDSLEDVKKYVVLFKAFLGLYGK